MHLSSVRPQHHQNFAGAHMPLEMTLTWKIKWCCVKWMNHPPNIRCCEIESKKVMPVHKIVEPSVTWSNRSKISLTLHWFHVFEIHHRLWEFRSSLSNNWCYCFWNLPAVIVKTTVLSGLYFEKRNWCSWEIVVLCSDLYGRYMIANWKWTYLRPSLGFPVRTAIL